MSGKTPVNNGDGEVRVDEEGTSTKRKTSRVRSPNFPGISFQEALRMAERLYEKNGILGMSYKDLCGELELPPKSSRTKIHVAALKHYHLLTTEAGADGATDLVLTTDVETICEEPEDSEERRATLKRLALSPPIFQKVLASYEDEKLPKGERLPSDKLLRSRLVRQFRFNKGSVTEMMTSLRESLAFYEGIDGAARSSDNQTAVEKPEPTVEDAPMSTRVAEADMQSFIKVNGHNVEPLTLSSGREVSLVSDVDIKMFSESDLAKMEVWFRALMTIARTYQECLAEINPSSFPSEGAPEATDAPRAEKTLDTEQAAG